MVVDKGLYLLYTCLLLLLLLKPANSKCQPSFPCKNYTLEYPFTPIPRPECGLWPVQGCESSQYGLPKVYMGNLQFPINIINKISGNSMLIEEPGMQDLLNTHNCLAFLPNLYPMNSPLVSFSFLPDLTLFSCYKKSDNNRQILDFFKHYNRTECFYVHVFYKIPAPAVGEIPRWCSAYRLPKSDHDSGNLFSLLSSKYVVQWNVSKACSKCYRGGGQCLTDNANEFYCKQDKNRVKLILAISVSVTGVLLLLSITYIIWQRKNIMSIRGHLLARITSSYPSSKSDIEGGIFYFGIPVFSCAELEEATNNFDPSQQLGDGGFGTVYHGKLRDGREVAIKRMYEHSFRRVEQFLNEIKILTSLRHPNLVSLYGCTSRRSQELLLVYEYISNGTLADHLHGDRAAEAALSWPVRMNIAIETATALAYLHKSDIIHRDVKTNNILLDSNFSVKVADFGLSRLFPDNVTHISTAPQGTPGYVDPEYHQFYKLTDKSDVYSFGVVLIELISSMPAVDVTRQGLEINLANLAMNRVQRCAFDELIDQSLGYDTDPEVTRMTTSVAELAFGCLQVDKDLRPSMDEVLSFLKDIQGGEDCNCEEIMKEGCNHGKISGSPERDDAVLLKNKEFQASPNAVTDAWDSSASTPASSTG